MPETLLMSEQAELPGLPPVAETASVPVRLVKNPRLLHPNRQQGEMRVVSLDDFIAEDHPVRAVWQFVIERDLSAFTADAKAIEGERGRPANDPAIHLALWLYGISQGVSSARELDRLTREHHAYRWLCGGVSVNYHTLSDFRNQGEKLDELLTSSLTVLLREQLVTLERVSQDGMRVRASAGAASFRSGDSLDTCLAEAQAQVEALKKQGANDEAPQTPTQKAAKKRAAEDRQERVQRALEQLPEVEATMVRSKYKTRKDARVSTTDPDARVMKMADGGFRPAYNHQVMADNGSRIIVGVDVTNVGSDMAQLPPMLGQVEKRLDALPKEVLVDGGYPSQGSLDDARANGVTVYAPVQKPKDPERDPYQPRPDDSEARAEWRVRMGTDEAKLIYKERGSTIEWVNAILRHYGLYQLRTRGLKKVRAFFILYALTHNLFRVRAIRRKQAEAAAAAA
jgi:transposase